jgi:hypothetical protein
MGRVRPCASAPVPQCALTGLRCAPRRDKWPVACELAAYRGIAVSKAIRPDGISRRAA